MEIEGLNEQVPATLEGRSGRQMGFRKWWSAFPRGAAGLALAALGPGGEWFLKHPILLPVPGLPFLAAFELPGLLLRNLVVLSAFAAVLDRIGRLVAPPVLAKPLLLDAVGRRRTRPAAPRMLDEAA